MGVSRLCLAEVYLIENTVLVDRLARLYGALIFASEQFRPLRIEEFADVNRSDLSERSIVLGIRA